MPSVDVLSVSENTLEFILPGLNSAPQDNRLVAISVLNGPLQATDLSAFTYVTDPTLSAIGSYNRTSQTLDKNDKKFYFNAGEVIGMQGKGLSADTHIRVNGKDVPNVVEERYQELSFVVPNNTVGVLNVEISNDGFAEDTIADTTLSVVLDGNKQLSDVSKVKQVGNNLFTFSNSEVRIYSIQDSTVPAFISKFDAGGVIRDIAVDGYDIAVLLADGATVHY